MNKGNATKIGKNKITSIEWYIAHYTPSISQQAMLSDHIISKLPTEFQYVEKFVFMKKVKTQKIWTFELGTQERINVPILMFVGFQQRDRQDSQNLFNDTFDRPPVTSALCIIGTEKDPDSAILLNYDDDENSRGNGQFKEAFRALTKDDILQPFITNNDLKSCNDDNDIGFNPYVFDLRHQKDLESAQAIKVEFKKLQNISAGIYGYALVLTNKSVSINNDGQRHFDLI